MPSNAPVPQITISAAGPPTSLSAPLWRRVFQGGRQRPRIYNAPSILPSDLLAPSWNINKSLPVPSEPEVAHNLSCSQTTPLTRPGPIKDTNSPKHKPEPPRWSVANNPEVERALDLQLVNTFKYDTAANCVKMSPNGQRLAVALGSNGKTCLYELQTGSKIWLVSVFLVLNIWIDVIDPATSWIDM